MDGKLKRAVSIISIVKDAKKAVEKFLSVVDGEHVSRGLCSGADIGFTFRGQPTSYRCYVEVVTLANGFYVEFLQPVAGDPSIWHELYHKHGHGAFQLTLATDDAQNTRRAFASAGFEHVQHADAPDMIIDLYDLFDDCGFALQTLEYLDE